MKYPGWTLCDLDVCRKQKICPHDWPELVEYLASIRETVFEFPALYPGSKRWRGCDVVKAILQAAEALVKEDSR